jgi:ankyrin repeat protein
MELMFGDRECLEEMGFTALHRSILGLTSTPLEVHLSNQPGCINAVDSNGRTALSWASQRGMLEAVEALLSRGAGVNICTPGGHSPLMYAAQARTPDCIQPLLDAGADVTQQDIEGQTALHYAAGQKADLAYYRPLLEAGSDPNWPTAYGLTPLTTVISEGYDEAMQYLVEHGADINRKGQEGRAPVFYAVEYNNHAALRFLHRSGADFSAFSSASPTIAHVAARNADIQTLQILTSFGLSLTDVDCVDAAGSSIPQLIERRFERGLDTQQGFMEAFNAFLRSITTVHPIGEEDDETDTEQFHDAMEYVIR